MLHLKPALSLSNNNDHFKLLNFACIRLFCLHNYEICVSFSISHAATLTFLCNLCISKVAGRYWMTPTLIMRLSRPSAVSAPFQQTTHSHCLELSVILSSWWFYASNSTSCHSKKPLQIPSFTGHRPRPVCVVSNRIPLVWRNTPLYSTINSSDAADNDLLHWSSP